MLPYSFFILQLLGLCRNVNWTKDWAIKIYNCYTFTILSIMYTNALSQTIYVLSSFQNIDELVDNTFILCTTINIAFKATSFVSNRQNIVNLLRIYQRYPCAPQNDHERLIRSTYDRTINNVSLTYIIFTMCTVTMQTSVRWNQVVPNRELFYKAWLPYNNSYPLTFWISHTHQMICQFADAAVNCTYDVVVASLMIHIIAQFLILDHRFEILPANIKNDYKDMEQSLKEKGGCNYEKVIDIETKRIAECIRHHLQIFQLSSIADLWCCIRLSNDIFSATIFVQYMASSFVLCATVYKVSVMTAVDPELPGITMYLTCMLFDVFLPCFFGHQATIESYKVSEAIYNMNWSSLSTITQRSLVLIMNRSLKPFRFTTGYVIQLSMDSFTGLIKLSYSVFNVLKQKSN